MKKLFWKLKERIFLNTIIIIFFIFLTSGCNKKEININEYPLVNVMKIEKAKFLEENIFYGQVKGRHETVYSFRIGGNIIARYVKTGDYVNKGDKLAELNDSDMKNALKITLAALEEAKAQSLFAEKNYERQLFLYKEKVISKAQYDESLYKYEAAQAAYKKADASFKQAQNLLSYTIIKAESNGTVTDFLAEEGQTIAPGQPILTILKQNLYDAEFFIPENRIRDFKENMVLEANLWANKEENCGIRIRKISPSADAGTRSFKIRADIINPLKNIKSGMTLKIKSDKIYGEEDLYLIPLSAIYTEKNKTYIMTVNNDNRIQIKPIKIITYKNEEALISGANDKDIFVIKGVHKLIKNQKIRPQFINQG